LEDLDQVEIRFMVEARVLLLHSFQADPGAHSISQIWQTSDSFPWESSGVLKPTTNPIPVSVVMRGVVRHSPLRVYGSVLEQSQGLIYILHFTFFVVYEIYLSLYIGRQIRKFPPVGGMWPFFFCYVNRDLISYEF